MAQTVGSPATQASGRSSESALMVAATFFAAVILLHNFDHVRRGADTAGLDVLVIGTGAIVLEIAVVILCVQRHRLAALAAAWSGLVLAVGYLIVHFTPRRTWLSDSLLEGADTLSLVAATLEVAAAAALAITGFLVLRARPSSQASSSPLARALVHPVAAVTIAGNTAAIAIAFAQR
ncbi:MAG TPA: hypothetical protein VNU01_00525 [Egibacteraceae bacterium]|nr:hypothetical protein [Egibacteraceae bacterium]